MGALSPHMRGTLTTIMPALVAGMMEKCKRRLDFNSYMILFLIMSGLPEGGLMRRHAGGSDAAPAAGRERFSRTRAAPGTPPRRALRAVCRSMAMGAARRRVLRPKCEARPKKRTAPAKRGCKYVDGRDKPGRDGERNTFNHHRHKLDQSGATPLPRESSWPRIAIQSTPMARP